MDLWSRWRDGVGKSGRKEGAAVVGEGGRARRSRRGRGMSDDMMRGRGGGVGTRLTSVALIVKLAQLRVCA